MYTQDEIQKMLEWNEQNSNKIGLSDKESAEELKGLIEGGLDPLEFEPNILD